MEKPVSGFRKRFYRDLLREYKEESEKSLLYQFFWVESVRELLEDCSIACSVPIKPKNIGQIRERLAAAVKANPDLILTRAQKKHLDLWAQLWLNNARYGAAQLSDTDYYLWLVDFLATHGIYYKDTSLWDIRSLLFPLLRAGLELQGREPGHRARKTGAEKDEYVFVAAQLEKDLNELAAEIGRDRAKIANRLRGLEKGYLLQLTGQLERMALHIKIKNWFQYSGYPLVKDESREMAKRSAKRPQKRDLSMCLLDAYFESGRGGQSWGGELESAEGWRLDSKGFCVMEKEGVEALQEALDRSESTCFYIPLGVDLRSGCVFFIAGKEVYQAAYDEAAERLEQECFDAEKAYQEARQARIYEKERFRSTEDIKERCEKARTAYRAAQKAYEAALKARTLYLDSPKRFCFDYLQLDPMRSLLFGQWESGFNLRPRFHKNAGRDYQDVLSDFWEYCMVGDLRFPEDPIPRREIRSFNREEPAGIPKTFHWAFEGPGDQEEPDLEEYSSEAEKDFFRRRERMW